MDRFARTFLAGWATIDPNAHMRNTAYLDLAVDARLAFFAEHGLPPSELQRLGVGPVVRRDEVEYFREVRLHDQVTVTLVLAAMAADGARFTIVNELLLADTLAARVTSHGGWLDLTTRRLTAPAPVILDALRAMPRAADFAELAPRGGG